MFIASFDEAKNYREKFRSIFPVVYNSAVLQHQPAPLLPPPNNDSADEKLVLPPVQLDGIDLLALENLFNANRNETPIENPMELNTNLNDIDVGDTLEATGNDQSTECDSLEENANVNTIDKQGCLQQGADNEEITEGHSLENHSNANCIDVSEARENDETNFNVQSTSESTVDRNALNNSSVPSNIEQSVGQKTIQLTTSTDVVADVLSIDDDGVKCRKDANESDVVSAQPNEKTSCSNPSIETRSNAKLPFPSTSSQTANSETLVTEVLGDDIEITYVLGKAMKPKIEEAPLKVKANDLLSGNLPFQEYVGFAKLLIHDILFKKNEIYYFQGQGDRSYIVAVQGGLKEVKLKGKAVNFLTRLNTEQRNDAELDLSFIKTMVICVFTCKSVRSDVTLEPELISYIRGIKMFFIIIIEISY